MKKIYILTDDLKYIEMPEKLVLPKDKKHISLVGYIVETLDKPMTE